MFRVSISIAIGLLATSGNACGSEIYRDRQFSFPDGLTKALILSYDDGPSQDRRFVKLLNECGLKGTFHINSGRLGLKADWMTEAIGDPGWYVGAEELKALYERHEVGSHTVNHPHLYRLDSNEIQNEVRRDIDVLERLSGRTVTSFAYPFGEVDDRILAAVAATGITNARSVDSTKRFTLPDNLLRWNPSAHHTEALGLVDEFLTIDHGAPVVFMIWGHSWEFDSDASDNNWDVAEALCEKLSGRDDIWYVGAGEFASYLNAVDNLQQVGGNWTNTSGIPVWIRDGAGLRRLPPE